MFPCNADEIFIFSEFYRNANKTRQFLVIMLSAERAFHPQFPFPLRAIFKNDGRVSEVTA